MLLCRLITGVNCCCAAKSCAASDKAVDRGARGSIWTPQCMLGVAATPHERLQMMASKSLCLSAGGKLDLPLPMCPINSRGEGWEPQPAILRKGRGGGACMCRSMHISVCAGVECYSCVLRMLACSHGVLYRWILGVTAASCECLLVVTAFCTDG